MPLPHTCSPMLIILVAGGATACAEETCTPENHCQLLDGEPTCEPGYAWEDARRRRCVALPCVGECAVNEAADGCRTLFAADCAYIYRCSTPAEITALELSEGFTGEAGCAAALVAGECTEEKLFAGVRLGTVVYDHAVAEACLATVAEFPCMPWLQAFSHPTLLDACWRVFDGRVAAGGDCLRSVECAGQSGYCDRGACVARSGEDYEIPCATPGATPDCPGGVCLALAANEQGLAGICTRRCVDNEECGFGGGCYPTPAGNHCFSSCVALEQCSGGFTCVVEPGEWVGACSITPL